MLLILTSAWCSSFCCSTSMHNSARWITSSRRFLGETSSCRDSVKKNQDSHHSWCHSKKMVFLVWRRHQTWDSILFTCIISTYTCLPATIFHILSQGLITLSYFGFLFCLPVFCDMFFLTSLPFIRLFINLCWL